ncbi:hypothetical protein RJ639_009687 [Escallonia herrerae]|uniref:Protein DETOXIFICATION n=1 Tax=Escallonia herrerae TaxID=1293975 RepID=A0AA89AT88_9ASTE|nr:hypothetical protein RJ639_009687 [Escallonia herrerae]
MGKMPLWVFVKDIRNVFRKDELNCEIAIIALPAALALTADPIASLIDTAFIGHIGPVELAAVGVAIAVFNQVSKIAIFPLVSVTTSFVAEEDSGGCLIDEGQEIELLEMGSAVDNVKEELMPKVEITKKSPPTFSYVRMAKVGHERRHISSASSALVIGGILGLIQTLFLICAAKPILIYMGVESDSLMLSLARQYLTLRSLGAPAVLLSLAMQGVFRGLKDTKTPLYATVVGDITNIILDPIFIFKLRMGVSGAAIAHVISQYLITLMLLWKLMEHVSLLPPSIKDLQVSRFLKYGSLLFLRVIAATFCVTLAASLAARLGSTSMAAFQVWLASSLLADGLAVAGQAILASAFAKKDYDKAIATASRVLQLGLALGIVLSIVVAAVLQFASGLFTKDTSVLQLLSLGIPLHNLSILWLLFLMGSTLVHLISLILPTPWQVSVAVVSIICLLLLSSSQGFVGIWVALSIFMSLRALAGFWRIGTGTGPWGFLRG